MNIGSIQTQGYLTNPGGIQPSGPPEKSGGLFSQLLDRVVGQANLQQVQAEQAVRDLTLGRTDQLHNVLLEVAKADLSFRLVLEIRNRLTEAYQEIMRMQI